MAATAPAQRLQARDQFKEGKRFAEVIVGTVAQAFDAVFDALAGGEHDHRGLLARSNARSTPKVFGFGFVGELIAGMREENRALARELARRSQGDPRD